MKHVRPAGTAAQRGFTLIELLIVFVLMGVLATLAAPSFMSFQRNSQLTATANSFLAALSAARAEAMKRQMRTFVVPADGSNWQSGWIVFVDTNSNASGQPAMEATVDLQVTSQGALPSTLSASAGFDDGSGNKYAMFNGNGFMTLLNGSFPTNGALQLDISNGSDTRRILASATGRLRVCVPDATTCSASASGL